MECYTFTRSSHYLNINNKFTESKLVSSFNLYEDAIREPVDEGDELSDAIVDPSTQ
jgi:hypothetical protein